MTTEVTTSVDQRVDVEVDDGNSAPSTSARLTIVVETVTHGEYAAREEEVPEVGALFEALANNSAGPPVAVLVVAETPEHSNRTPALQTISVRVVGVENTNYYAAKNAGVAAATTEYVAFLDGDAIPGPSWASDAIVALDGGADVVAGKTRYVGRSLWVKMMNYLDFFTVRQRSDGTSTGFHLNNVAFRRDVYLAQPLDARLGRSGACTLMARRLRAAGRRIVYEPSMTVSHGDDYKETRCVAKRLRNGHDSVKLRQFDDTGVVEYPWILALGPFGAPLVVGRRIWDDLVLLVRQHREVDISPGLIPVAWLITIPMRCVEGIAYAISSIDPSIIGRRWDDTREPSALPPT